MALLNTDTIVHFLNDKTIDLRVLECINSTNNAFENTPTSSKITICVAETQTQGRGQLQRVWHSPFGENIYLSLCYFSYQPPAFLAPLSLAVGYTLCSLLNTNVFLPFPALVKWPNDILCNRAKLAGILVETKKMSGQMHRVVIGIGLNVNMQSSPDIVISNPWTSLMLLTGKRHDRNVMCANIIGQLQTTLQIFETKGFSAFEAQWNHYNALYNQTITLNYNGTLITGKCIGISCHGMLIVELPNGEQRHFFSGEARLQ